MLLNYLTLCTYFFQDFFNKFSNESTDLQSQNVDLGTDNVLTNDVAVVGIKRDFSTPSPSVDDNVPQFDYQLYILA